MDEWKGLLGGLLVLAIIFAMPTFGAAIERAVARRRMARR